MGFNQVTARGGGNIQSLAANDKTEFQTLTLQTYQKIVKLTLSQLETVRKIEAVGINLNGIAADTCSLQQEKPFRLGWVKA